MPNWCSDSLTVEGGQNEVAAFLYAAGVQQSADGDLTSAENLLGAFVPMPDILARINRGSTMIDGERVSSWITVERDGERVDKAVTELELDLLRREHGATDWYDWAVTNWGTKWDTTADATWLDRPTKVRLTFDTAWSPPVVWANRVAARFPALTFTLAYSEIGAGYIGFDVWKGGVPIDDWEWQGDFMRKDWDWDAAEEAGLDFMDGLRPEVAEHLSDFDLGVGG